MPREKDGLLKLSKLICYASKNIWLIVPAVVLVVALGYRFFSWAPELSNLARASDLDSVRKKQDSSEFCIQENRAAIKTIICRLDTMTVNQANMEKIQLFVAIQNADLTVQERQRVLLDLSFGRVSGDSLLKFLMGKAK